MDSKLIDKILTEEKRKLNILLPHVLESFKEKITSGGFDRSDAFMVGIVDKQIKFSFNESKNFENEEDIRAFIRHELCHVLDYIEGKTDFEQVSLLPDFKSDSKADDNFRSYGLNTFVLNAFHMEIASAYDEYLMAKRFIKIYGLEDFKKNNEIGMDEFLAEVQHGIKEEQPICFIWIYSLFKEAMKTSFYAQDERFPVGIWKMIDWLREDFDYIDSLKIKWLDKSQLLFFEALAIFENIDLESIFEAPIPKPYKKDITFEGYKRMPFKKTIFTKNLTYRWLQRFLGIK